jgi:flavin-dependent dehydrogenase
MSPAEVERRCWDVLVVGAGPAGAMAAYELASRSLDVLLVDKNVFPRPKVCGCCLNGQALAILRARGLGNKINQLGAVPLRRLLLVSNGRQATLRLPAGAAVSRQSLDMALVNAAVEKGAVFLPNMQATLGTPKSSAQEIVIRSNGGQVLLKAKVLLAADGLSGSFSASWVAGAERKEAPAFDGMPGLRRLSPGHPTKHAAQASDGGHLLAPRAQRCLLPTPHSKNSRIGAATIIEEGPAFYRPGTIYMACGARGYVGLVRLEDGRLNIAAAFDSEALRESGHAGNEADKILHEAGLPPIADILQVPWKGTPRLTRRAKSLAAERLFVLGDAASFVEPFTGEGIAWALRSAIAVAPLAARAVRDWKPRLEKEWNDTFHREVERRQIVCRLTAALLHRPRLTTMLVRLLGLFPSLSNPVLRRLNSEYVSKTGISQ